MRLVGIVLVLLGIAGIVYGAGYAFPPNPGALTAFGTVRAVSCSLGLIASIFGVVLIALSGVEGTGLRSISWGRFAAMFLGLFLLAWLTFQCPDLLAAALGKSRDWARTAHDVANFAWLCPVVFWTARDTFARRTRARGR